ncbi:ArnT family glycosyltransferase [Solirubrobacter soli]|uniref:ArnT family glycosyltransferase n=1 Tax=Solirubrobacter soli TaxID=363832 RepID=UPI0004125A24|nr:glycosyltransferase family 39 protein [Solirubrobacter soli]
MNAVPVELRRAGAVRMPAIASGLTLAAITILAATLRLWAFASVPTNPFYDAAVRSMTLSWHNFFYGAFEPGAGVAVDKMPADLWLQVASVEVFGFNSVALRLPEVLAAILAIPLIYDLVRRLAGSRAGLAAAAALAVCPAAILTAHSDTMDSAMMLLDVAAAWLLVQGVQQRRIAPVIAAGAVLGLAFEVKLFEALIVAPALAAFALVALDLPWRRRTLALAGSTATFLVTALAWPAVASLTPLDARPWPIGSTDGSIWNVIFGFNGIDRLTGSASARALAADPPGLLRLFSNGDPQHAARIGTLVVAAVILGAAALVRVRRPLDRRRLGTVALIGVWIVVGVISLSLMGRLQPRYLETLTPAIAAAIGIGAASAGRRTLAVAVACVIAAQVAIAWPPAWVPAAAGIAAAFCWTVIDHRSALVTLALIAVLIIPGATAVSVAREHRSDAGLRVPPPSPALSAFLLSHHPEARYEVASPTVARASTLIIRDAQPVLMLTSLYGRPLLTAGQLREMIVRHEVRYLLGRGACPATGTCPPVIRWAHAHARDVSSAAGLPRGTVSELTTARVR